MNYVRTSAGGMMPITFKSSTLVTDKKQLVAAIPTKKSKKESSPESK